MDEKIYQTIQLAGLFHDIGKYLQLGDSGMLDVRGRHPQISANFIQAFARKFEPFANVDLLKELVRRHHESSDYPEELRVQSAPADIRPLAYLINRSDNYSSFERKKETLVSKNHGSVALASVFSRITMEKPAPEPQYYNYGDYRPGNAFPKEKNSFSGVQVTKSVQEFETTIKRIFDKDINNFDIIFSQFLSILQRYTWCSPSNTQEALPDVSLYDHLKTTCAISACLYLYHLDNSDLTEKSITDDYKEKFLLAVGDLSGIQKYIFDIAHGGGGGVARRLRARSFMVSAILESVSYSILELFNLPLANIVISSGGKFYILLPRIAGAEERLAQFRKELENYLYHRYRGGLAVNLAWVSLAGKDFHDFGQVLLNLSELLQDSKSRPFSSILAIGSAWSSELFVCPQDKVGQDLCDGCKKEFATVQVEDALMCHYCEQDLLMGKALIKAKYVSYKKGVPERPNEFAVLQNYVVSLHDHVGNIHYGAPLLVQKINEPNIEEISKWPGTFRYLANYIPADENNSAYSFDTLAKSSKGKPYIGYFKADVDSLGQIFIYGLLGENGENWNSISRLTTLSRMLDLFFSGWVEEALRKKYNRCYSVFSGGDDLFLVGPWSELVDFAHELRVQFDNFTGSNQNLTLSASLIMGRPKVPIARMAGRAECALEKAKETVLPNYRSGRNQLFAFDTIFKWNYSQVLSKQAKELALWIEDGTAPISVVRKLASYSRIFQEYFWDQSKSAGLRYLPLLAYEIGRNFANAARPEKMAARDWLKSLMNFQDENASLHYLDYIIGYALYATRRERE